ncbi:MAG: hypothetical protein KDC08_06255 [Actinobacteria bacterium]|mgnify:CR=1 FL=1|nr:hypothetical protein [Actinomycetota bacterium]
MQSHMWTEEVRSELSEALPDFADTLLPEEVEAIAAAMERTPTDTLLVLTEAESERLNGEEVPLDERSDASLIFLLADLVYGPNRWNDSHEVETAFGEWSLGDEVP